MRRRVFLQDDLPGAALMVRVGVGMEEAECDGADVERFDAARRLAGACLVKRAQHLACVTDSLGNLEAQMPRDDRLRLDPLEVVHAGVVGAHDLEHIPNPLVVTNAAFGSFRSSKALRTTVAPCTK